MKHELRVMQAQGSGSIINISSTYGHLGARGTSVYAASKHAVEGLTKSVALEAAASGVRVNAVAPGPVETAMLNRFTGRAERKAGLVAGVPLQRVGEPDEIANAIVFLASDKSSFTTGQRNAVYTKRGTAIAGRTRFARDSLLEGDGFEPSVPPQNFFGCPVDPPIHLPQYKPAPSRQGPMVRIHIPPAASRLRT